MPLLVAGGPCATVVCACVGCDLGDALDSIGGCEGRVGFGFGQWVIGFGIGGYECLIEFGFEWWIRRVAMVGLGSASNGGSASDGGWLGLGKGIVGFH